MKKTQAIWILEDEPGAQFVYEEILGIRYTIRFFSQLSDFVKEVNTPQLQHYPSLILADLRLPDHSFLHFLNSVESKIILSRVPFLVVSSIDDLDILRLCFKMGATDYLTKPFKKTELIVKIERTMEKSIYHDSNCHKELYLDPTSLTASKAHQFTAPLTAREFQIISAIQQSKDRTISRDTLFLKIWGASKVDPKVLDVHLVNLRRKINPLGLEIRHQYPNSFSLIESDSQKN